jgi:hypothetical protein
MKKIDLKNWNAWRIIRMGLGLFFAVNGFISSDYLLMSGGLFLSVHALVNYCAVCVDQSCELPKQTHHGKI